LNFPPISQEVVLVLHIKNYALSSRIACLCWAFIEHFTYFMERVLCCAMPSSWGVHEIAGLVLLTLGAHYFGNSPARANITLHITNILCHWSTT
jgi:hypothetical protein